MGPEEAEERLGPDACYPLDELHRHLPAILDAGDRIHYRLGSSPETDRLVREGLARARARGPRKGTGPRGVIDPGEILDELRLRKDPHEAGRLRDAARLTMDGHLAAAAVIGPGVGEWMVQAELEAAFRRGGGCPGFGSIVGSGANACVLHYRANQARLEEGQLVLVDAGAELACTTATSRGRTRSPAGFSDPQRRVYDLVDAARAAAVAAVRPGVTAASVHDNRRACPGGRAGGDGDAGGGCAHPRRRGGAQGLLSPPDVPLAGPGRARSRGLCPPGCVPGPRARHGAHHRARALLRPEGPAEASAYAGIGVRIEDDVLVTEAGCENLTGALPTEAEEVADLVGALRAGA